MCLLRPISALFSPEVPYHEAHGVYERPITEKITRIAFATLSGAVSVLSAIGFAISGNPLALASAFVFGCVTCALLDMSGPFRHFSRMRPPPRTVVVTTPPPPRTIVVTPTPPPSHSGFVAPLLSSLFSSRPVPAPALRQPSFGQPPVSVSSVRSFAASPLPPAHQLQERGEVGTRHSVPPQRSGIQPPSSLATQKQLRSPVGQRFDNDQIVGDPRNPEARGRVGGRG